MVSIGAVLAGIAVSLSILTIVVGVVMVSFSTCDNDIKGAPKQTCKQTSAGYALLFSGIGIFLLLVIFGMFYLVKERDPGVIQGAASGGTSILPSGTPHGTVTFRVPSSFNPEKTSTRSPSTRSRQSDITAYASTSNATSNATASATKTNPKKLLKKLLSSDAKKCKRCASTRFLIVTQHLNDDYAVLGFDERSNVYNLIGGGHLRGETRWQTGVREFTEEFGYTFSLAYSKPGKAGPNPKRCVSAFYLGVGDDDDLPLVIVYRLDPGFKPARWNQYFNTESWKYPFDEYREVTKLALVKLSTLASPHLIVQKPDITGEHRVVEIHDAIVDGVTTSINVDSRVLSTVRGSNSSF